MIKKGLKVKIIAGKDKNKEGEVIEIDRPNNRAKIKELNMVKKHIKTTKEKKGGIVSFVIDGINPGDLSVLLDQQGIAIRAGHHCAQPVMNYFKIPGTVRISFSFYNTKEEIDLMIKALNRAITMLQ